MQNAKKFTGDYIKGYGLVLTARFQWNNVTYLQTKDRGQSTGLVQSPLMGRTDRQELFG